MSVLPGMTVGDAVALYERGEFGSIVSRRWSVTRAQLLRRHVLPIVGAATLLADLAPRHVLAIQRAVLVAGDSPTTANTVVFGALRALLRDAEVEGALVGGFRARLYAAIRRLRRNPVEDRSPFDARERVLVLERFRRRAAYFVPFITLALGTGARPGELLGLRWADVDLARRWIRIARSREGGTLTPCKTVHSRREVAMTRLAATALSTLRRRPHDPADFIVLGQKGLPLDLHNFTNRVWRPTLRELAVRVAYRPFYATRHTFISEALMAGKSSAEVAAYCGTSVQVIQAHYYRFTGKAGQGWEGLMAPELLDASLAVGR